MRNIFGRRPTRFDRGDAVRLKKAIPGNDLEAGIVGTIGEVRRSRLPSYDVQFINTDGAVRRFVVDEADLMPADGRRFDDGDAVKLRRDLPSEGLSAGDLGTVSGVTPGPPVQYAVEFAGEDGQATARATLVDEDLASPDDAIEPAAAMGDAVHGEGALGAGLADEELDSLIEELRSQGQAMQQQNAQSQPGSPATAPATAPDAPPDTASDTPIPAGPAASEPQEEAPFEPVEEPLVAANEVSQEPPADGRRTRFVRGESVRLDTALVSDGVEAGTEGTVTWAMLGPPVAYLVEFRDTNGGIRPPTKVEESYLSFAG